MIYDLDFNVQVIGRQRIYKVLEDENIQTPITTLSTARTLPTETGDPVIDAGLKLITEITQDIKGNLLCRHVETCLDNPFNKEQISRFDVIVPYRPTNPLNKAHVREILNQQNVKTGRYKGEGYKTMSKLTPYL
ncbi:hypothetical protein L3556_00850 [Candidatus Synechococcus calcipolaris G9]|uniref:Uncharacterized protein n=1 Tax=Candidatus Synechococcus calcipolaris G9 TaxID=1497997 RepID=A0ABT6EUD0_9SYNE|nr:hypothetical protein [Candidatus Synechococcus calcipolaris]MDG2989486.1 hypothetical protein [Candidatus Synechococcus calcipolaris G9]